MVQRLKHCIFYVVTYAAGKNWHQNLPLGCNHQQEGYHCCGLWVTWITNWGIPNGYVDVKVIDVFIPSAIVTFIEIIRDPTI
jgi:hypothetical protein